MSRTSRANHLDPENVALSIEKGHHFFRPSDPFVETKANVHRLELGSVDKELHSFQASHLFFGDKNEVDRSFELLALLLQPPHRLDVLDADTFHVLSSTAIDVSLLIFMGREGRVCPVLRKN